MFVSINSICRILTKSFTKIAIVAVFASGFLIPNDAKGEGFALQDWSARGGALGGGVVARGGDASAAAYNPAAITELEGLQVMVGAEIVVPTNTIVTYGTTGREDTKNEGTQFILPQGYLTYKINDQFSLGLAMFSRFGLGNEYDEDWPAATNVFDVSLMTSTFNPSIAWRVNDMLSLAAGIEISGALVEMRSKAFPGVYTHLEADGITWALGYNLAAHIRFNEQWKLGLTYRSNVDYDIDGELTSTNNIIPKSGGSTTMSLPHEFKAAVAYYPLDNLSFEFLVGYYTWSSYKDLKLTFDNPGLNAANPRHWEDTWLFSLSAEYDVLDWLTLRAGIAHETSPVPDDFAEYSAPVNGRFKYSIGAGFHKDAWAIDVGYIFHHMNTQDFDKASTHAGSDVLPGRTTKIYANAFLASFSYKF